MANINNPSQKTSNKDHLKVPIVTFFNRFQKVYFRFLSFGKDCKISVNIRLPKGATISKKTGIVEGHPDITKQILVYIQRFENVFRQSILEGREPSALGLVVGGGVLGVETDLDRVPARAARG